MAVSIWGGVAPEDFMGGGGGGGGGYCSWGKSPKAVAECNWLVCPRVCVLKDVSFTDAQ